MTYQVFFYVYQTISSFLVESQQSHSEPIKICLNFGPSYWSSAQQAYHYAWRYATPSASSPSAAYRYAARVTHFENVFKVMCITHRAAACMALTKLWKIRCKLHYLNPLTDKHNTRKHGARGKGEEAITANLPHICKRERNLIVICTSLLLFYNFSPPTYKKNWSKWPTQSRGSRRNYCNHQSRPHPPFSGVAQ